MDRIREVSGMIKKKSDVILTPALEEQSVKGADDPASPVAASLIVISVTWRTSRVRVCVDTESTAEGPCAGRDGGHHVLSLDNCVCVRWHHTCFRAAWAVSLLPPLYSLCPCRSCCWTSLSFAVSIFTSTKEVMFLVTLVNRIKQTPAPADVQLNFSDGCRRLFCPRRGFYLRAPKSFPTCLFPWFFLSSALCLLLVPVMFDELNEKWMFSVMGFSAGASLFSGYTCFSLRLLETHLPCRLTRWQKAKLITTFSRVSLHSKHLMDILHSGVMNAAVAFSHSCVLQFTKLICSFGIWKKHPRLSLWSVIKAPASLSLSQSSKPVLSNYTIAQLLYPPIPHPLFQDLSLPS